MPLCWDYDGGYNCNECAANEFTQAALDDESARDRDGNRPYSVSHGYEWFDEYDRDEQFLECQQCGETIDSYGPTYDEDEDDEFCSGDCDSCNAGAPPDGDLSAYMAAFVRDSATYAVAGR